MRSKARSRKRQFGEAERWYRLDTSALDVGRLVRVRVDPQGRTQAVSIRLPVWLLAALKAEAKRLGLPYQRLIRQRLEATLPSGWRKARRGRGGAS